MRSLLVVIAFLFGISAAYAEPSDAVAEFYAGHAALQQGDPALAITHFSKALDLGNLEDTQVAYVHHYRAIAYQRLDRHQEAIDDYTQALAIGTLPKRVQAAVYYNRAIALDHLSNYDRAIKDYSQAIALKPDYAEAYMNRGNAYRKLSDNDAALRDYESSAAYGNPIKHLPYYGEGLVLEAKGDKQGALKAFQTALLLAPDFEPARAMIDSYKAAGIVPAPGAGTTGSTVSTARPATAPAAATTTVAAATTPTAPKTTPAQTVLPPVGAPASAISAPPRPATPTTTSTVVTPKPASPTSAQVASTSMATPPAPSSMVTAASPNSSTSAAVTAPKPSAPAAAATPTVQVASTSASSGAFLVQVGAFVSEDMANSQATSISSKYGDLLTGLTKDIQRADLGPKGIYFRLRYGPFATRNDATDRCSQLKARGQDCIIIAAPASAG